MKDELIYENITKLQTPVGYFAVMSDDDFVPFFVQRNGMDWPCKVTDDNNKVIGTILTDTNYCIVVDANSLQLGKKYTVKFVPDKECKWEECNSDELTICYDTIIDDWVVGIGAYDPNAQEKDWQAWKYSEQQGFFKWGFYQDPPEYDESKFTRYSVDYLDTYDGFRFKLYDHLREKIYFEVAWIKIGEYPVREYEAALGYWLS